MTRIVDLTAGQKIGNVEVIRKHHTDVVYYGKRKVTKDFYLCRCKCGKEFIVYKHNLTRNVDRVKSCGCAVGSHHHSKERCMKVFYGMCKRCYNKKSTDYKNYGGRGIKVCDEWRGNPEAFYQWAINNGYKEGLTIERTDVNKDYCPENCKWIPKTEQCKNKRNTIKVLFGNKEYTIEEICRKTGLKYSTVYMRIKRTGMFL